MTEWAKEPNAGSLKRRIRRSREGCMRCFCSGGRATRGGGRGDRVFGGGGAGGRSLPDGSHGHRGARLGLSTGGARSPRSGGSTQDPGNSGVLRGRPLSDSLALEGGVPLVEGARRTGAGGGLRATHRGCTYTLTHSGKQGEKIIFSQRWWNTGSSPPTFTRPRPCIPPRSCTPFVNPYPLPAISD